MPYKTLTIIVTYNGAKWVDQCFGSLRNSSIPIDTIVIDNGSNDNTVSLIKENFPEIEIVETGMNLGFGKANNIGLKKVIKEGYDFAFLLNQDAWIEVDTIEKLIQEAIKNPQNGIISPIHLNGKGDAVDYNFSQYIATAGTPDLFSDLLLNKLKGAYTSSFINAACWLMTKNCVQKVGGFNPLFDHYGEDDNYIQRLHRENLRIRVVTDTYIYHDRAQGVANSEIYNKNKNKITALLNIADNEKNYNKLFFIRNIIGYVFLQILFLGRREDFRQKIKQDLYSIKILRKKQTKGKIPYLF